MTVFVTQSDIQLSGPGLIGSDVAGSGVRRSKRITIGAGLSLVDGELVNSLADALVIDSTKAATFSGAITVPAYAYNTRSITLGTNFGWAVNGGLQLWEVVEGQYVSAATNSQVSYRGGVHLTFASNSSFPLNSDDVGFIRHASSTVRVSDASTGYGDLIARNLTATTLVNIQNSTTPTQFNLHNTYTSATSREYLKMLAVTGGAYQIGSAIGSAGGTNRDLDFGWWDSAGTFNRRLSITAAGVVDLAAYHTLLGSQALYVGGSGYVTGFSATVFGWSAGSYVTAGTAPEFGWYREASNHARLKTPAGVNGTLTVGSHVITQPVATSGSPKALTITGGAHTTLPAGTEVSDIVFDLGRTVQFANGTIPLQRAVRFIAPTYSFVGPGTSTITEASTVSISGPPGIGTNAAYGFLTRYALKVESGDVSIAGHLSANTLNVGGAAYHNYFSGGMDWLQLTLNGASYFEQRYGYTTTGILALNNGTLASPAYSSITCGPAAGILEIRGVGWPTSNSTTTAQTLRLFNVYTSATSSEYLQFKANTGGAYQIGSAVGSAGGTNRDLSFGQWDSAGTFSTLLNVSGASGGSTIRIATTNSSGTCGLEFGSTLSNWKMGQIQVVYDGLGGWGTGLNVVLNSGSGPTTLFTPITISSHGNVVFAQAARTTGSPTAFTITGAAHTTLTASTEATDVNFNLARTVQFANGAITTQRAFRIQAPVYSHVSGSNTITTASTLSISGPPTTTGGFTTITNAYALNVESGKSRFGDEINLVNGSSQTLRIAMDVNNPIISSATTRMIMGGTAVWLKTDGGVSFVNSSDSEMGKVTISSFNLTLQSNTNGSLNLIVPTSVNGNQGGNAVNIVGQTAASNSVSVLNGGAVNITGGNGASASAGNAYGGDIVLTPGTGYGSGRQGVISILGPITNASTGITEIRYGTTAQTLRLYSAYTSSTSFESLTFAPTTSAINIGLQVGSAGGTSTRNINIGHWDSSGTFITRFTSATSVTQAISDTTCVFRLYGHGDVATGTQIQCYKARGTDRNTKLYPVSGDIFGGLNCYGYDENASNWSTSKGAYIITASGNWTSTANGTQHTWQVTNSADATKTLTTVMTLTTDGSLNPLCGINSTKLIRQNAEVTYTPTGTTQTITLNDGNHQTLNLTSATGTVTATLTVPTSSSAGTIIVNQHASAAKGITWAVSSGTIKWMGTQPTWSSDATSSVRLVSWRWNGSIMYLVATDVGT